MTHENSIPLSLAHQFARSRGRDLFMPADYRIGAGNRGALGIIASRFVHESA